MEKVSFEEIERLCERLKEQGGECIMIVNDGESDATQCSCHCFDKGSAGALLAQFFESNPELIPIALHAIGLAMEFNDDCQLCDYDDNDEDDDDDDDDGEVICMN